MLSTPETRVLLLFNFNFILLRKLKHLTFIAIAGKKRKESKKGVSSSSKRQRTDSHLSLRGPVAEGGEEDTSSISQSVSAQLNNPEQSEIPRDSNTRYSLRKRVSYPPKQKKGREPHNMAQAATGVETVNTLSDLQVSKKFLHIASNRDKAQEMVVSLMLEHRFSLSHLKELIACKCALKTIYQSYRLILTMI